MRNVTRPSMPSSLRRNAAKWRRELLIALQATNPDRRMVDKLRNRYKSADVRENLNQMYGNLCCYCEAEIGVVAFEHIEHRKPQALFPQETFAWKNLHLACPKCNQAKGNKWNQAAEILDSVVDNPIRDHLNYELSDIRGCVRWPISQRGRTTIDHADLNRRRLRDVRTKIALGVLNAIQHINRLPESPDVSELRLELSAKTSGPFGTSIGWLMDSYMRPLS